MKLELFQPHSWIQNLNQLAVDVSALPGFLFDAETKPETSFLFLNEQLNNERKLEITHRLEQHWQTANSITEPCLLMPTSGTTSHQLKIVIIKKTNFLNAAKRVNTFLKSTASDIWLVSLPLHHVAGLSILARAFLNGNKTYYWTKWDPQNFVKNLQHWNISFCSLVPTQIFDLVSQKISAPKNLKTVLVGGSALPAHHWDQMLALGWPLLKTFGMTETAAFMSTSHGDNYYDPLPDIDVKLDAADRLAIKTDTLFEGYLIEVAVPGENRSTWQFQPIQLQGGFWSTEDRALIKNNQFQILGRDQGIIKIKGELVNVQILNQKLTDISAHANSLAPAPVFHFISNERNEHELFAIFPKTQDKAKLISVIKRFNELVLPYERINWYIVVDEIPRTDLGKIKTSSFNTDSFKESYFENRQSIL